MDTQYDDMVSLCKRVQDLEKERVDDAEREAVALQIAGEKWRNRAFAAEDALRVAQARADAANDALLDTVADLSRYQAQSAEFERDYEREKKRAEGQQKLAEAAEQRITELEKERDARMSRVHKFMDILGPLAQVGEMEWDTVRRLVAERDAETARADAVEASLAALHEAYGDAREEFGFQWDRAWYNERLRADALAQQVAELRDALRAIVSDDPHHVAVYLQASGITETFDGYVGKDIWAIAQDALARLDTPAEKENAVENIEPIPINRDAEFAKMRAELEAMGKKVMNLGIPPELMQPPPAPAPPTTGHDVEQFYRDEPQQGPYRVGVGSKDGQGFFYFVHRYNDEIEISRSNHASDAELVRDALNAQEAAND